MDYAAEETSADRQFLAEADNTFDFVDRMY